MGELIDLTGKRFGRLIVISYFGSVATNSHGRKASRWRCVCDCGEEMIVRGNSLATGKTRSCGCLQRENVLIINIKHGYTGSSIYRSWQHMKARCLNPKDDDFKHYGGRGIKVCSRWIDSFEAFLEDMGEKPKGLTIERIDNNKGYSPENCKWATQKEQTRNTRRNRMICYKGITMCLADWADWSGIGRATLAYRLNRYPPKIAFNM